MQRDAVLSSAAQYLPLFADMGLNLDPFNVTVTVRDFFFDLSLNGYGHRRVLWVKKTFNFTVTEWSQSLWSNTGMFIV